MQLPMNSVNNLTLTSPQQQYLNWINNFQGQEGANQQALGNDYYHNFLNQATGTGATSAQAGANSMMMPQGKIDNSWIFKDPTGSGKQAQALGMNNANIQNMNSQIDNQQAQQKANYVQMLLRFMPQFSMPSTPAMSAMGGAQQAPGGGTVFHGLEGLNNWAGNATGTPQQAVYNPEDLYAAGNPQGSSLMNAGINSARYGNINQVNQYQRPATTPEMQAQYTQQGIPFNQFLNQPNKQYADQLNGGTPTQGQNEAAKNYGYYQARQ